MVSGLNDDVSATLNVAARHNDGPQQAIVAELTHRSDNPGARREDNTFSDVILYLCV